MGRRRLSQVLSHHSVTEVHRHAHPPIARRSGTDCIFHFFLSAYMMSCLSSTRDAGTDPFFLDCHGTPTLNRLDSDHAMRQHWYSLYNQHPQVTLDTLHDVRQRPQRPELAAPPSDDEIVAATRRARPKKAPGPNEIPVEFWKALVGSDAELLTPEGQAAFAVWKSSSTNFGTAALATQIGSLLVSKCCTKAKVTAATSIGGAASLSLTLHPRLQVQ